MIRNLFLAVDGDRNSAERPRNGTGGPNRFGSAFHTKNNTCQFWIAVARKSLHGMKRARRGAASCQRFQNLAVQRPTGMERDLVPPHCGLDLSERARHTCERSI